MSVVLTVVQTVGEADVIAALLRTEGIACSYPQAPWYAEGSIGIGIELRVAEADYERACELIAAGEQES